MLEVTVERVFKILLTQAPLGAGESNAPLSAALSIKIQKYFYVIVQETL